jgi:hypothetical protein
MMPRNLIELAIVLVAGLAVAVAALGKSYVPVFGAVMVGALFAWVLVRFQHWRRGVRLALAAAPIDCAECSRTSQVD